MDALVVVVYHWYHCSNWTCCWIFAYGIRLHSTHCREFHYLKLCRVAYTVRTAQLWPHPRHIYIHLINSAAVSIIYCVCPRWTHSIMLHIHSHGINCMPGPSYQALLWNICPCFTESPVLSCPVLSCPVLSELELCANHGIYIIW